MKFGAKKLSVNNVIFLRLYTKLSNAGINELH